MGTSCWPRSRLMMRSCSQKSSANESSNGRASRERSHTSIASPRCSSRSSLARESRLLRNGRGRRPRISRMLARRYSTGCLPFVLSSMGATDTSPAFVSACGKRRRRSASDRGPKVAPARPPSERRRPGRLQRRGSLGPESTSMASSKLVLPASFEPTMRFTWPSRPKTTDLRPRKVATSSSSSSHGMGASYHGGKRCWRRRWPTVPDPSCGSAPGRAELTPEHPVAAVCGALAVA